MEICIHGVKAVCLICSPADPPQPKSMPARFGPPANGIHANQRIAELTAEVAALRAEVDVLAKRLLRVERT